MAKLAAVVQQYIEYMKEKQQISAAMVVGSYATGQMDPNSDVDIFFIWPHQYKSMRGREWFQGVEFEYFVSPEWKFYHRMKDDPVTMNIYASAQILFDPDSKMRAIIETAKTKANNYQVSLSFEEKKDYLFWLETIKHDGIDLYDKGAFCDFLYFTGSNLHQLSVLICKLSSTLPTYSKYGVSEAKAVDESFFELLQQFLTTPYTAQQKKQLWVKLCTYVAEQVGDIDITTYESVTDL